MSPKEADKVIKAGKPITVYNDYFRETITFIPVSRDRWNIIGSKGEKFDRGELKILKENPGWASELPTHCDLCQKKLTGKGFVDGKTRMGPRGIMCYRCFEGYGIGLGTGKGQLYDIKTGVKIVG